MPGFIEPELCRVVDLPAGGALWVHEVKFDGYRMQLRAANGRAVMLTRKGLDWTHRYPEIAAKARALPDCVIDGEVVALDEHGISNFGSLQSALSEGRTGDLVYFAFDLLYVDGRDLRATPLTQRKELLENLLQRHARQLSRIRYVQHFVSSGKEMLEAACKMGLEGVISKRADSPYRSGRSDDWTKAKCRGGQEIVVGGWWGDSQNLRSLLAGAYRNGEFVYMGRVGTGFNAKSSAHLLKKLKPLEIPRPAFANAREIPRARSIHWVEPKVVAEIEFGTITSGGILRQASYKGVREDKPARNVVIEPQPAAQEGDGSVKAKKGAVASKNTVVSKPTALANRGIAVAGVAISSPDKVLWPATKTPPLTKADLARYYETAGPRILPHIAGRPLSMVRAPDGIEGEHFFQRHVLAGAEKYVTPVHISGRKETYVSIDTVEGLVAMAQAAVLELHPWGSKPGEPDVPARLIFDLDPAPDVTFDTVIAAAKQMRAVLEDCGFTPFVKTTGGKGIHVVVAIKGRGRNQLNWKEAKEFARDVCLHLERDRPEKYTTNMSKKVRGGKIFLDFLRNDRMATAVAAWSPRARPGATISTPLPWSKLRADLDPAKFNLADAKAILRTADPWKDLDKTALALDTARKRLE